MTGRVRTEGSDRVTRGRSVKLPTKKQRAMNPKSELLVEKAAVALTETQRRKLDSLAHHYKMSASAVVRVLIEFGFDQHDIVFNPPD